jgi:predicted Zn-dependent protease
MIWRVAILAVAVLACAWFALGIHQVRDTTRASAMIGGSSPLSPQQARRARSLIDSAATINPDLTPAILRGQLASQQGQYRAAERILEPVTRSEPLNLQAWLQLAYASARDGDRGTLIRAGRHIAALFPKVK